MVRKKKEQPKGVVPFAEVKPSKPRKKKVDGERRLIAAIQRSERFSGPLPHPQLLKEYGEIVSNGAERIFAMVENQMRHRISLEKMVIESDVRRSDRGLILGFVLSLVIILGGFGLVLSGRDVMGIAAILTAMATLIGVFIYTRESRKKELESKSGKRILPPEQRENDETKES